MYKVSMKVVDATVVGVNSSEYISIPSVILNNSIFLYLFIRYTVSILNFDIMYEKVKVKPFTT